LGLKKTTFGKPGIPHKARGKGSVFGFGLGGRGKVTFVEKCQEKASI